MAPEVDVAVIGSGVVGAAVLAELAAAGLSAVLVERSPRLGGEITERNSGVVHAGLYYPPGSLKTRLCLEGRARLYRFAERHGVPHRAVGKLIVATDDAEVAALSPLLAHAEAIGAGPLTLLDAAAVARREPAIVARAALWSPTTGIVDPVALTRTLLALATDAGATALAAAEVVAIDGGPPWTLRTARGPVTAERVVNAAGLGAARVAALAGIGHYRIYPCRGDYFRVRRAGGPTHLVYPVKAPGAPGLGIHFTVDLAGQLRLGPDAEYLGTAETAVSDILLPRSARLGEYVASADALAPAPEKRPRFLAAARRLWPALVADDLEVDQVGIRPKLRAPDEPAERDFVIAEDRPGFLNLVGIESPGLTASLAIAAEVARRFGVGHARG